MNTFVHLTFDIERLRITANRPYLDLCARIRMYKHFKDTGRFTDTIRGLANGSNLACQERKTLTSTPTGKYRRSYFQTARLFDVPKMEHNRYVTSTDE